MASAALDPFPALHACPRWGFHSFSAPSQLERHLIPGINEKTGVFYLN